MLQSQITDSDVREVVKLLVEVANRYFNKAKQHFGDELLSRKLALIISDTHNKFGFFIEGGKFKFIEGEDVNKLRANAIVETTKDFFIKFLNSSNWTETAVWGYNTYQVNVISSDNTLEYVHYRNLMQIIAWLHAMITKDLESAEVG